MSDLTAAIEWTEGRLSCAGAWISRQLSALPAGLDLGKTKLKTWVVSAAEMTAMDTAGALFLQRYLRELQQQGVTYRLEDFQPKWLELMTFVADNPLEALPEAPSSFSGLAYLGQSVVEKGHDVLHFFDFIGQMVTVFMRALWHPRNFHLKTIVNTAEQCGVRALPIVGLLCFLIGVVLAYQLGIQLKTYGANILIVFLTGLAMLREFGPLIAAIIMAGRTSSAFTAEIGSMKVNQETDALMVMGLSPMEFLVIPKVVAMLLVFPLLIFWADLFGVLGSMLMAKMNLGVSYIAYLHEFGNSIDVKQFLIGLSKAPAFALIIVLVGCYQGFQVQYSADSIGKQTTRSVVQAIFLIIIADALFSVLYGHVGV